MKIIPFKAEHVELMESMPEAYDDLNDPVIQERFKMLEQHAMVGTFIHDGRILAIVGIIDMWPGVCELFSKASIYCPQHTLIFARTLKRYLKEMAPRYHRIQMLVRDTEWHNKFLAWFGFIDEGTLVGYGLKKQNYKMWRYGNV
jgi:hypothetical protein